VRVVETIDIERSIDDVWHYVSDPNNDPVWCPKVKAVHRTEPGHWRVTHKPVPLRPATLLAVEQVAVEPPHRLTLREEDTSSVFDIEYRLEQIAAQRTRFTQASDFRWKLLPRLIQPIFTHGVRRDVRHQLRELKRELERSRS
jgi:uncharacterized protein YndB with AHSA1/START domain